MIHIYMLGPFGDYELCQPVDDNDYKTISNLINGESRQRTWKPPALKLIHKNMGKKLKPSDSPWYGSETLILKKSVIHVLGDMLRAYGEILPAICKDDEVFLYNPTHVIDALNNKESEFLRFSSGRIMDITKYVFYPDRIKGVDIFKIPDFRVSPIFVQRSFVDAWNAAGLKGLEFEKIWSED